MHWLIYASELISGFEQARKLLGNEEVSGEVLENELCLEKYLKTPEFP